ncbi:hypothetical protein ACQJBY_038319 [Aegilops geniculata]
MGRVYFETDCMSLHQALSSTAMDRGSLGFLFREGKYLMHLGFFEYKTLDCSLVCNLPVHVLAKAGVCGVPDSEEI